MLWANTALVVTKYTVISDRLPANFNGFRIAQISDLHNTEFGEGNYELLELLAESEPDMIVITGDLIDSSRTDTGIALDFVRNAAKIAPVYYVTGNHELLIPDYREFLNAIAETEAIVLRNEQITVTRDGESITILGVDDPCLKAIWQDTEEADVIADAVRELMPGAAGYSVLLCHRPELFDVYVGSGADLVFTGHAHGGQFRLPLVGGLVAPNQGLFPEYDSGCFTGGTTTMVVSRGLGNSVIPIRLWNRPEIVLVGLKCAKE